MRIGVVSEHFWPESFLVNDLVAGLVQRGHRVEVLTAMPNYPAGRYFEGYGALGPFSDEHGGAAVRRVPVVPRGRGQAWRLVLNYGSYAAAASLRAPFVGGPWDVTLVFQPSPVTTAVPALVRRAATGTPVVLWVQDLWPESISATGLVRSPTFLRAARRLSAAIYTRCDRVLAQSRAFLPRLQALGVAPRRLGYLPNWAEERYHAPAAAVPDEPWMEGFPILFAGNLGRVQALDTILGAARRLRHERRLRWVFIGDGPLRAWLAAEIDRAGLGDQVFLLGRKPSAEMPGHLARAGALLVTLKRDDVLSLTVPSKVQAYLAAGRPILGSIDGEAARVIDASGAGWATPADDSAALAASALRMLSLHPDARADMGRRGQAYCMREFERGVCLDRVERVLGDAAGEARAAGAPARAGT